MENTKTKIGNVEIILIIIGMKLGERIISLPGTSVQVAGYGAVISVFAGGLLALLIAYLFARLALNFPDKTILEFSGDILGKWLGKLAIFIFFIYFFLTTALYVRRFGEFLRQELLYNTPIEFVMITFLFIAAYCAIGDMPVYSKTCDFLVTSAVIAVVALILVSLTFTNFEELRPAFQMESIKNIHLVSPGITDFLGFEIVLFLVPFMKKPKDIKKNTLIGMTINFIIYTITVIVTMGILTKSVLEHKYYPVFDAARTISIPGFFDIRFDILFASLWIFLVYVVLVGYQYLSSITFSKVCGLKAYSVFVFLFIPLFYAIGLLPQNLGEVVVILRLLGSFWLYFVITTVFLIYIIGIIRKKVKI